MHVFHRTQHEYRYTIEKYRRGDLTLGAGAWRRAERTLPDCYRSGSIYMNLDTDMMSDKWYDEWQVRVCKRNYSVSDGKEMRNGLSWLSRLQLSLLHIAFHLRAILAHYIPSPLLRERISPLIVGSIKFISFIHSLRWCTDSCDGVPIRFSITKE